MSIPKNMRTAILEGKLEEIEKEIFTDSMESFQNSLANIL
jgi:hypothetical protein